MHVPWAYLPCNHACMRVCSAHSDGVTATIAGFLSCSWQDTRSSACWLSQKASGVEQRQLGHQSHSPQPTRCAMSAPFELVVDTSVDMLCFRISQDCHGFLCAACKLLAASMRLQRQDSFQLLNCMIGMQAARFTGGLSHRPSYAAPPSPLAGKHHLTVQMLPPLACSNQLHGHVALADLRRCRQLI